MLLIHASNKLGITLFFLRLADTLLRPTLKKSATSCMVLNVVCFSSAIIPSCVGSSSNLIPEVTSTK